MGVKISALPAIVTPAVGDLFATVQAGVTYKVTDTQLSTIFATSGANSNITSLTGITTPLSVTQGGTGIVSFGTGVASGLGQNVTGSGGIVLNTSPTLVTSLTFNPTTGGIVGTPTNNNATAGIVGESISNVIAFASAVSLTTTVIANVTSIALTAGDWDIVGNVFFNVGGASTLLTCWSNSTSVTQPDNSLISQTVPPVSAGYGINIPNKRYSVAGATTVYLSVVATFSTSTVTACGGIYARRVR